MIWIGDSGTTFSDIAAIGYVLLRSPPFCARWRCPPKVTESMFNQFPAEQLREDQMTKIEVKNKFIE
jgi:hypothetical protein